MRKSILFSSCLFLSLAAYNASAQTIQWWDNSGTSTPTSGTWDTTTANWATSTTLTTSTAPFANNNFAVFTGGSTTISSLTINVPGVVTCEGLGDGTSWSSGGAQSGSYVTALTFSGAGSINLPIGAWSFECGVLANTITIDVPLTGSGGIVQHNSGAIALYGNNTYSGGTEITGGQIIYFNNNNSFGTGPITNSGGGALYNTLGSLVTLPNAFTLNSTGALNFSEGNTTCAGPWYLLQTALVRNNSPTAGVTISGVISGAFGLDLFNDNAYPVATASTILSGANTYTGPTSIGLNGAGGTSSVSVTSINSVTTPTPQASSSLGCPSSVANGTIALGQTGDYTNVLIYTGPGETSDRVINLSGTTGPAYIEMDGTGPLVLTSAFTATGAGSKTLFLQGSSTAANTIGGAIVNDSSTDKTSLTKAQAGTWVLSGVNTFTGNTTISAGTLTIGGAGSLTSGSYAGTIANSGTFIYNSTAAQTLSGVISGSGTLTDSGTGTLVLSGLNTYTGNTTLSGGILQVDSAETAGSKGPLGDKAANAAGSIILNGGTLQFTSANKNDYSGRFSTAAGQAYNIDVNGQPVTFGTALSSSTGTLTLKSTATGGVLTLNAAETYSGATTITSGTLTIGSSGSLGGGNDAANITDNGTFNYSGSGVQTLSGTVSGSGALTENSSELILTAADTYTGATTISGSSTLLLSGSGSINNSTSMNIGAGSTFDVSALASPYTLSSTSMSAIGSSSTAATINGAPSGVINLGSQPISLTISPTTFTGDTTQLALVIAQASLTLSGNVITVNNASGAPLGAGNYVLIQPANGTTGTPSQYVAVTGSGLVGGVYATVQVSGGNVVLMVTQPPNSGPTWNGIDYANSQNWSDSGNWTSGVPDTTGDQVSFANTSGPQTPVMDSSYSVYSLTFLGGCSADILTASGGSSLMVGSGVTNSSGNLQTLALPVHLVDLGDPTVQSQWDVSGGNITASGVISDNNTGLAVSGGNTLTLSGANTFTGPITLNTGASLSVNSIADGSPNSLGEGNTVNLSGGGTITYTGTGNGTTARTFILTASSTTTLDVPYGVTLNFNGKMNGSSPGVAITKIDSGTLVLGGVSLNDSYFGMNVNGGTVILNKSGSTSDNALGGATTVGNGGTLQFAGVGYTGNGFGAEIYNGTTTPVTIYAGGVIDMNGQNNSINVLNMAGNGSSGGGALINSASGTTSTLTCPITLTANATVGGSGNITLPGLISGSGMSLTYAGTGILTLTDGSSTYSGGTTVNAGGTLQLIAGNAGLTAGSAGTGAITLNGNGALNLYMTNTEMNNVITGGSTSSINIKMGSGNLWLSNSAASQLNSFNGTFNVNSTSATGGQLVIGTSAYIETISSSAIWEIQSGAVIDFNVGQTDPATVYLYGAPYTGANDGSLRLDDSTQSGNVVLMGNSQIGNGSSAGSSTVSGIISDGGLGYGFTKVGADPVILSAANTYTGPTIINTGTLDINTGSIAGNATVNSGTLFEMDNATAMASTATLNVAASGALVSLNYGGTQTIASLFIGGVQQAPGVYGPGAYNPGGIFTGYGTLTITTGGGSSPVTILSANINGANQLVISWGSIAGSSYNVYTTPSLNPPATWTLVNSSPITSQGTTTIYTLPGPASGNLFVSVQQ